MKCLSCDCEKFEIKDFIIISEVKSEEVEIPAPAFVCAECHTLLMDSNQVDILIKRFKEIYNK